MLRVAPDIELARHDLSQLTEIVWLSTLGLPLRSTDHALGLADHEPIVAAFVRLYPHARGARPMTVTLHCPLDLARRAAASLYSLGNRAASDEQTHHAMGHLVGIVASGVTSLLPVSSRPAPAGVRDEPDFTAALRGCPPPARQLGEATFDCDGRRVIVRVCEDGTGE
jgi:hypothetical protein